MLMLLLRAGEQTYAIPTSQIVEIVPRVELRVVPGAPSHVAGLLRYRGGVVPVVDLSQLLAGTAARNVLSTRIVLAEYRNTAGEVRRIGVIAEGATETTTREASAFDTTTLDLQKTPYLGGVAAHEGAMLQWIHLDQLLAESLRGTLLSDELPAPAREATGGEP